MTIDLYYCIMSAPCRSVMLTAKALGLQLNLIDIDFFKQDHLKPEFVKINPQHCIPTLNDNGFVLAESRAICCYLVEQYGKDDSLYPKEPKKRALVNQKLNFDMGTLYQRFLDYYCTVMWMGEEPNPARFARFEEGFEIFDKLLEGKTWAAGDHLTIADIDLVTTVSSAEAFGFDIKKYPNVSKWLANCKKTIPGYDEINHAGCMEYKKCWEKAQNKHK